MVQGDDMKNGKNAKDHRFEAVTVLGYGMLFTPAYLDPNTIPKGVGSAHDVPPTPVTSPPAEL